MQMQNIKNRLHHTSPNLVKNHVKNESSTIENTKNTPLTNEPRVRIPPHPAPKIEAQTTTSPNPSPKSFDLLVVGDPKGQPRPRAFARKIGGKFVARVYEAGTAEAYKSAIAMAAKEKDLAGANLEGPIALHIICRFSRPKSHFRTGKRSNEPREDIPLWHTKKPDGDNILKAIKDALTQVGAWRDDSQVCRETIEKKYTSTPQAVTIIRVSLLEE